MNIGHFRDLFTDRLASVYEKEEILFLFRYVAEQVLGLQAHELSLYRDREVPPDKVSELQNILDRLSANEPVQYVLGRAWFCGKWFKVTSDTLIPRQETEELVAWVLEDGLKSGSRVLDIGTGSGCIAVSLKHAAPEVQMYALDKSGKALKVATENADAHRTEVVFKKQDILELGALSGLLSGDVGANFDVVVSNPPYVRDLEKKEIEKNVLEFEPGSALFVPDSDPLIFYRKIAELAWDNLLPGGRLYFEINQYLGKQTYDLVRGVGFEIVELREDLSGNQRMLKAIK